LIQNFSSGVVEKPKRVLNLAVRNGTYIANPESTRAFLDMVLGYDAPIMSPEVSGPRKLIQQLAVGDIKTDPEAFVEFS